jgi:hypothetical protein
MPINLRIVLEDIQQIQITIGRQKDLIKHLMHDCPECVTQFILATNSLDSAIEYLIAAERKVNSIITKL